MKPPLCAQPVKFTEKSSIFAAILLNFAGANLHDRTLSTEYLGLVGLMKRNNILQMRSWLWLCSAAGTTRPTRQVVPRASRLVYPITLFSALLKMASLQFVALTILCVALTSYSKPPRRHSNYIAVRRVVLKVLAARPRRLSINQNEHLLLPHTGPFGLRKQCKEKSTRNVSPPRRSAVRVDNRLWLSRSIKSLKSGVEWPQQELHPCSFYVIHRTPVWAACIINIICGRWEDIPLPKTILHIPW